MIDQQARGIELSRHIGKFSLNQLMAREWLAELLAHLCMQKAFVKRASRHAARSRANTGAKLIKRLQRKPQAVAGRSNHVLRRDTALGELEFADRMRRNH